MTSSSGPGNASYIDTATDLAGRSWGAWAENGLLYAAHWDGAAQRWGDAAPISNAIGGRNVHLTVGQVLRDSASGQNRPTLIVTWESGADNDADVYAAVGFYRNDGTVLWSDAVNLLPGGVAESNHSIGISGNRLLLATEAQPVINSASSGGLASSTSQYQDSEINTYSLSVQSRSSLLVVGDPAFVQTFSGSGFNGALKTLNKPNGISGGKLITAAVNGTPLSLDRTTEIPGLGSFTLSSTGELSFTRGQNPVSELLFSGELIGSSAGGTRSYARTSSLLRPSALALEDQTSSSNAGQAGLSADGYTISVSNLNGSGAAVSTTTVPLRFNASDRLERVSAATFAPSKPITDGSALRDFTGSGRFSDTSLGRALASAKAQTSLESVSAQGLPSSLSEWSDQTFTNPYVLYKGQIARYSITLEDALEALTGSSGSSVGGSPSIPFWSNITNQAGLNLGFDGLINYSSSGDVGYQQLTTQASLNLRLGQMIERGNKNRLGFVGKLKSKNPTDGGKTRGFLYFPGKDNWLTAKGGPTFFREFKKSNDMRILGSSFRSNSAGGNSQLGTNQLKSITLSQGSYQQHFTQNSDRQTIAKIPQQIQPLKQSIHKSNSFFNNKTSDKLQRQQSSASSSSSSSSSSNNILALAQQLDYNQKYNFPRNSSNSIPASKTDVFANFIRTQFVSEFSDYALGGYGQATTSAGYLFGVFPLRAIEVLFAARENYSYSTSNGLADPSLQSKRFQFGGGFDLGFAGSASLGLGYKTGKGLKLPVLSIIDVQAEVGVKASLNFGWAYSQPQRSLTPSLIWKDKNYERAYLPFYENSSTGLQNFFNITYYTAQGIQVLGGPFARVAGSVANPYFLQVKQSLGGALSKTAKSAFIGSNVFNILNASSRIASQLPFVVTAGDIIFSNLGLGSNAAFANSGDPAATLALSGYLNGSVSLINGLVGGYTRNSAGINLGWPSGWQYSSELGYIVGGVGKSLWNVRDQGTWVGDSSGYIANTYAQAAPALHASLYGLPAASDGSLDAPLTAVPIRLPATGGAINLAALASFGAALSSALTSGAVVVSIDAVVQAPTSGAVDADGNLIDFKLSLTGSPLPLRLAYDKRSLLSGSERLKLANPWQSLINQWADPSADTTATISGVKPGALIPLQIDLRLSQGSDPTSLASLQLGYQLESGSIFSFATAEAPLLAAMPDAPQQRSGSGSAYQIGPNASGSIGAGLINATAPYISSLVITDGGSGYADGDFLIEDGTAVVRGHLVTEPIRGGVTSADIYQTASSAGFGSDAYRLLSDSALKARVSSGSDAQVSLSVSNGKITGASLALGDDGKTAITGSGYLAGSSGVFQQWIDVASATAGQSARALLRLVVTNGSISDVGVLKLQGSLSDSQPAAVTLTNSIAGNGSGLQLVPLLRSSLDTNLLDESGLSIGSFSRYVDGDFRSEADLVFSQMGPDRSKAINSALNLDIPLQVNRFAPDGRGFSNIALLDPAGTYTPGVDGYNFDSSINSVFFNNDSIGGKRSVLLFSHADLRAVQSERDLYLLEEALQQAQVYAALEQKDPANNLFFGSAQLLSDPSQGGTNSNGTITPFYAVQGAGVAPIFDANKQLLATWVHTSPAGQSQIQVRIGTASGTPDNGSISWSPISSIALPEKSSGNDVTELSLSYLNGRTPVLSWSLNSLTPYQAGVLKFNPTAYYRLNDDPSQGTLSNISATNQADGQIANVSEIRSYSSWMDTAASPLTQEDLLSSDGALLPTDAAITQPGDSDPALNFGGGVFAEVPNLFLNRLSGLNNDQPAGYAADLWVNTSVADGSGSILDNGLFNPNATLPTSQQLQLPVQLRRIASTESVDGVDTAGYRYTLVVPAGSYADLGLNGLGDVLSPFNLRFAAIKGTLNFSGTSSNLASRSIEFNGADLADLVQYRTQAGKLSSFTLGDQEVVLTSFFEADATSAGTTKDSKEINYDSLKIGVESQQIAGWSLRKRVVGDQQFVDFNYGIDKSTNTPATLSARLPDGSWSHVAISYGIDTTLQTKVARLYVDGTLAALAAEDPENLKGYDFNLLPYQLGYHFKGSLDELVLSDQAPVDPDTLTSIRQLTRYVDPRSASQATFTSPGVYDIKTGSWDWQPAGPIKRSDYIPSTIPGVIRSGPVDMVGAGSLSELRGDGTADLQAILPLRGIAVGSLVTGLRVRLANGEEYAVGDGLRYGMDGKPNNNSTKGLIGVLSSGSKLNSGAAGTELDLALMNTNTDLNLLLPIIDANLKDKSLQIVAFVRSPQNRSEGGDRFTTFSYGTNATTVNYTPGSIQLKASGSKAVLSPYYSKQQIQTAVQRPTDLSLLDINTGFVTSLAQTNEPTLADPSSQVYAEAIVAGNLKVQGQTDPQPFIAIGNPQLDGIGGIGNQRGVVWVLPHDVNIPGSNTVDQLQQLQSLVNTPESKLDELGLEGLVVLGRDGQQIGGTVLWADLNGDQSDDLVIASPASRSSGGIDASGSITVISGAFIAQKMALGAARIDLANIPAGDTSVRVFAGPDNSEFGTALAYGNVLAANRSAISSYALLIGAPGYSTKVSTDFRGNAIDAANQKTARAGAVFQLKASSSFFTDSSISPQLLVSGDLPGLPNFNNTPDPQERRFGASITVTSATNKRDFTADGIADIAIGVPGLVLSRVLKGGINPRATTEQRDTELESRITIPDVYRESMDATQLSDPKDVNMGGVLLLQGGTASLEQTKKVLLLGDTVFGDAAGAGAAVASGGDFNAGSIDDLVIGMPEVDSKSGAISLVSGANIRQWFNQATATNYATLQHSAVVDASLIIQNDQANGLLGRTLALNGDVNRDGNADLVFGDANYASNSGRVGVLFGSASFGAAVKGQTLVKSPLGTTVYHRLDVSNPDTRLDIYPGRFGEGLGRSILLAPNGSPSPSGAVNADLLLPSSNGSSSLLTLYGKSRLKGLGSFSSGDLGSSSGIEISDVPRRIDNNPVYGLLGDINGDGNADALVDLNSSPGRPRFKISFGTGTGFSPDHQDAGSGGSSGLDLSAMLAIQNPGADSTTFSLRNVQSVGDLTNDGINDLLIRYQYFINSRTEEHSAILLGGDLLTSNVLFQSAVLNPLQPAQAVGSSSQLVGQRLDPGEYLLSDNGRFMAFMQHDGNFVVQTLNADGVRWDVSFSLNDYRDDQKNQPVANSSDASIKLGSTPGTRLELRNGQLCFVNDNFKAADGSNAIALGSGYYFRNSWKQVTTAALQPGANLSDLRLRDDGVLLAKASDGTTLFSFSPSYGNALISTPIPSDKLSGLTRKTLVQGITYQAPIGGDVLQPGQRLNPGDFLLSANGRFLARMQSDGNFVVQTLRRDGITWDVSFSLNDYIGSDYNQPAANISDSSIKLGSTPGTRLELRDNGQLCFINDKFKASDGSNAIAVDGGFYVRAGTTWKVRTAALPAGSSLSELRLGDDGVLIAKASDGTSVFSFEPRYANDLITTPIPAGKLPTGSPKASFDQAPLTPIGTAPVLANSNAPTLLALAENGDASQLRFVLPQVNPVDVAALYDSWFAGFPLATTQTEQNDLDSISATIKQELLPFDPNAADAAAVGAANLDILSGILDQLAAGAGASFRNYVEGRKLSYSSSPVTLLNCYGDVPTALLAADARLPQQNGDVLLAGQRMVAGDYLLSRNGRFMALMQPDGNFVVQTLNANGVRWDVSLSLNDLFSRSNERLVPTLKPGTSLEIRNGKLCFINDNFNTADGSHAITVNGGFYDRAGSFKSVTTADLAPGASFKELRLNDDGVLVGTASDGSRIFSFQPSYTSDITTSPIPAVKLQGLRKISGYDRLDPSGRSLSLVDRNGDGLQELLVAPGSASSDSSLYSVALAGQGAAAGNLWFASSISGSTASNSFLWSSTGDQPVNQLSADLAGTTAIRKINGYSRRASRISAYGLDQPDETRGYLGVNGASLSRSMLYLGGLHQANTYGQYSRNIGGTKLSQHLSQNGDSFELKLPAYVWQMKTKGEGKPAYEGGDEMVLHIGSGSGIRARVGDTSNSSSIALDGLAISFHEYKQTLSLFWNGQRIFQAGPNSTGDDLARLLASADTTINGTELATALKNQATNFMAPDGGLHNNQGLDKGFELMSWFGNWISNLMTSACYIRYQQGAFQQNGKTYQGKLIMEVGNAARYLPYDNGLEATMRLNSLNKALQICIPLEQSIQLNSPEVNFNAYGWSGAYPGLHALAGVEFNTDKPLEGTNLQRLTPVGDLNGDGHEDMIGLGSLASGWNYDYKLDLPNNNLNQRGSVLKSEDERIFTVNNGANGTAIARSTLIAPVIVWGSSGDVNLDNLTPIVRGSSPGSRYLPKGTPGSSTDPGLASLDNFTAADNVHYTPLGDVNADGFDDVGIADYGTGGSAYILYGGPGLKSTQSYLERFAAFLPETRGKDTTNLPIQVAESPDVYLTSNPQGFGIDANDTSAAWINAINLERSAADRKSTDPAFGSIRVSKITGINNQQLADLSGGGDFSGDGLYDLFLTTQQPYNAGVALSQQNPSRYVLFGGDLTQSVTLLGTPNNDSLKGTPVNDVIASLAGNDIVQGKGGMDAINTGPGDDQIYVDDDQFRSIEGGSGSDTLILQGQRNQAWDFTKLAGRIRNIESLDLSDFGANSLTLNAAAVRAMSGNGRLLIDSDPQPNTPLQLLASALVDRLAPLDASSAAFQALADLVGRISAFNFSRADLSILHVLLRDLERDLVFDHLRALRSDTSPRPLAALRARLDAIDAATPLLPGESAPASGEVILNLAGDFMDTFSQSLSFTHASALEAYNAWLTALPTLSPKSYGRLSAQQKADLAGLSASWQAAYPAYFTLNAIQPTDWAFEQRLDAQLALTPIVDTYRSWISDPTIRSTYNLPDSSDPRQSALLTLLTDLEATGPALLEDVLGSVDNLRLSTEFSLVASDVPSGSITYNEYSANGGSVRLLVPDWIAVVMDPSVPGVLTPTPPTVSSAANPANPGISAEALPSAEPVLAPASAPASRDDLRITVSESRPSEDGRSLVFTLTRSGFTGETTRVSLNTTGYVNDLIPSVQGQVVFAPGDTSEDLIIPLMQSLPEEQAAANPYDQALSQQVGLDLTLLPSSAGGPASTSTLAFNALNAYTPELNAPSRALDPSLLDPRALFDQNITLQFPTAIWITAQAINNAPIRFALDNPQGQPLNDIRLLDRNSGNLVSLFDAAAAGDAVIYGDTFISPSTDLYFSVTDGDRFDQDGSADGQTTLAAAGARTSPGSLFLGEHVLRAPSSSGLNLLFQQDTSALGIPPLRGFNTLFFLPTDDTDAAIRLDDGTILHPSDGQPYLDALSQRWASASPFAAAIASVSLSTTPLRALDLNANAQNLRLLNDTNYIPVLSSAAPGSTPSGSNLALPRVSALSLGSRANASYLLQWNGQALIFSLSSPYLLVPGLEGNAVPLSIQFRPPSGSIPFSWHAALLRVDDPGRDLLPLFSSADLSQRLTVVPADGRLKLQAGDTLLPLLFQGITPEDWVALPPSQRLLADPAGAWSITVGDPGLDPDTPLRRTGNDSFRIGSDGLLSLFYGNDLQASVGSGEIIRRSTGADNLSSIAGDNAFRNTLLLTGDGPDTITPALTASPGDNIIFSGAGSEQILPLRGDIVFSGSSDDQIATLPSSQADDSDGARVDGGAGNDSFSIRSGSLRLIGADGNDTFSVHPGFKTSTIVSGGTGTDRFWLLTDSAQLPAAPLIISDFSAEQGDRLVLQGYSYADLNFQQRDLGVQINIGNTPIALLLDRTLEQIASPANVLDAGAITPDSSLIAPSGGDTTDPSGSNTDGTLTSADLISDGVRGLAAFARKAFGADQPLLSVYIHNSSGPITIGGGRIGQQTINTLAFSDSQLQWIREQFANLANTLNITVRFVNDRSLSNFDLYYDSSIDFGSQHSTLGITLNNDNGRQVWTEIVLNAAQLSADPQTFRYGFHHETMHGLGGEHPFDNSDGDSVGTAFGSPDGDHTLMSYTRPVDGWPPTYRLLDWAALVSLWGLNPHNTSGWRFRNADGSEVILSSADAIARFNASANGASFLGRADGLIDQPADLTNNTSDSTGTSGSNSSENTGANTDNGSSTTVIDPKFDPTPDHRSTTDTPFVVDSQPLNASNANPSINWQSDWQQLDLELGAVLDRSNSLRILNPADLGLTPSGSLRLAQASVIGSPEADVVFCAANNLIDLDAGEDTLFSLAAGSGSNRLYGGDHADRFFLAAAGDLVYGGIRLPDTDESGADGKQNAFFIDLDARASIPNGSAPIEIRDFQLGRDSLTLIEGDPSLSAPLPISSATYLEWRNKLQNTYNVTINAAPMVLQAKRKLAITRSMLRDGFSFSARDLFADLDTGDLTLVGLDKNPPWLQLLDGKLQVAPGANVQSGSYTFAVAGSDGMSRTPLTSFSFAVDPQVSIGSLNLAAGSALEFRFNGIGNAAVELLVQTFDANDQPLDKPRLVAGQMGLNAGLPAGLDGNLSNAVAGDLFNSGRLAFFLRKPMASAELIPLEIRNKKQSTFSLSSGSIRIDAAVVATPAAAPLITFAEVEGESMLGLALPSFAPSSTGPTRKVSVSIDLFREAAFHSTIGFYLADFVTGAVVDGRTGSFITGSPFDDQLNPSADYMMKAAANSVWKGSVGNGLTTTITQTFDLHASIAPDNLVLLPFMEVDSPGGRHTFIAGSSGNRDRISHITKIGSHAFGFEDQIHGGDFDFDDMVAVIRSVNTL